MNETKLSKRLTAVAAYIPQGSRLADIGSDHAYLPVYLAKEGLIDYAVAGEVAKGPFDSAQNQVKKSQLTSMITVRHADGLAAIEETDQIDCISICGMGGSLIATILEDGFQSGKLDADCLLVLQPNVGEETLRKWLMKRNYQISAEEILVEDEKIYEIIVAKKVREKVSYQPEELFFGPYLLKEKAPVFRQKWTREQQQIKQIIKQIQPSSAENKARLDRFIQQEKWLQEVL